MPDVTYKVVIAKDSGTTSGMRELSADSTNDKTPKEPQSTEEVVNKQNKDKNNTASNFAKFMTVYGITKTVAQTANKISVNQAVERGDNLAATMQNEQFAIVDKVVSSGLNILAGGVVAGVPGMVAVAGVELYGLVRQSIDIGINNQHRINMIMAQRHIQNENQERFVRNATTEKIRTW